MHSSIESLIEVCFAENLRNFAMRIITHPGNDDDLMNMLCDALVELRYYPNVVSALCAAVGALSSKEPPKSGPSSGVYCKAVNRDGSICCLSRRGEKYCSKHAARVPEDECSVCMEPMWKPTPGDCGHKLCEHCYVQWYVVKDKSTCPLCRGAERYHKLRYILSSNALNLKLKEQSGRVTEAMPDEERARCAYDILRTILKHNACFMFNEELYRVVGEKLSDYESRYRNSFPTRCGRLRKMFDSYSEFRFKIM